MWPFFGGFRFRVRVWHVVCERGGTTGALSRTGREAEDASMQKLHRVVITAVFSLTCFTVPVMKAAAAPAGSLEVREAGALESQVVLVPEVGLSDGGVSPVPPVRKVNPPAKGQSGSMPVDPPASGATTVE